MERVAGPFSSQRMNIQALAFLTFNFPPGDVTGRQALLSNPIGLCVTRRPMRPCTGAHSVRRHLSGRRPTSASR